MMLGIASELRVVGHDSEHADMVNPRGEIIAEVFFVTAEHDNGEIEAHEFGSTEEAEAQALLDKVRAHVEAGGTLDPDRWLPWRARYGSSAWDEGAELEREWRDENPFDPCPYY